MSMVLYIAQSQMTKNQRYLLEFGAAMTLYMIVLWISVHHLEGVPSGVAHYALGLLPMIGVVLAIWAIIRHHQRVDEYIRKRTLEYLAISAAVTAGWTLTYGFLETAGFPRLSMFYVWPVMGAVWFALATADRLRGR